MNTRMSAICFMKLILWINFRSKSQGFKLNPPIHFLSWWIVMRRNKLVLRCDNNFSYKDLQEDMRFKFKNNSISFYLPAGILIVFTKTFRHSFNFTRPVVCICYNTDSIIYFFIQHWILKKFKKLWFSNFQSKWVGIFSSFFLILFCFKIHEYFIKTDIQNIAFPHLLYSAFH